MGHQAIAATRATDLCFPMALPHVCQLRCGLRAARVARRRHTGYYVPMHAFYLLFTLAVGANGDSRWEVIRTAPLTTVERRSHAEGFYEIRVSTLTDVRGEWIADAYWNERDKSLSTLKKYQVLSRTADEKVSYLQVHLPIVKDRDYTIRIVRDANHELGLYQFTGHCVGDVGPPPNTEHVRVAQCMAQLTIEPAADGRTHVTYVAYANPAGQLPKWLVNTVAPKAAAEVVDKLIELARSQAAMSAN